jgi:hypothetical protein
MAINALEIIVIEKARALLSNLGFVARHRAHEKAFTRKRSLTFDCVMLLVLQKTLKAAQLHLQEFFGALAGNSLVRAVTSSAWTQARAKLKHTAFVELNRVAIVEAVYADDAKEELTLWRAHRLLPVDGSVVRMPESQALFEFFGGQEQFVNQKGPCGERIPQARLSVLYDCLNRIVLDARVGKYSQGERDLLLEHLGATRPGDVIVLDRGYAGYLLLAEMASRGLHFIARCHRQSFAEAGNLFERDEDGASVVVTLSARSRRAEAWSAGLPLELKVRFVSLRLPTGELEVLVTTLVDESAYPTAEFLKVYHLRWGVETLYGLLKGRLDLENFSGLTVEAVLQDIHSAVFLTNLESVVTREAAVRLPQANENGRRYGQKINRAVSLHALKSRVVDLLLGKRPADKVLAELTELFLANPITVRPNRTPPPRSETPRSRTINFIKRVRKIVF